MSCAWSGWPPLRYVLGLIAPNTLTFAAFFPVITLAAFLWGRKASILAVGLSTVVAWYFFLPTRGSFATHDLDTTISLIMFVCSGGLIAYIGEAYHQALHECQKEQEKRTFLVRELTHRGRNTFAVVQGIVTLSLADNRAMAATINERFAALFATNQLLTSSGDQTASLKDIINAELEYYGTKRIRASGPEVVLTADLAQAIALIIHELGTNAAKYGALSSPNGVVIINWDMDNKVGSFTWAESASKVGFGTTLITSLLTPFDGRATLDFRPTGLECHFTFSVKRT